MNKNRYLTKSRFKLACECPTKLYYYGREDYANQKKEDSFLEALAEGGFQVGELAKLYYPEGIEVKTLDNVDAIQYTNKLLSQKNIVIFEAALKFDNLFVRVDILEKTGNQIKIIEVKAKSFNFEKDYLINKKGNGILSVWQSYANDIAFQKYVAVNALSNYQITAYLMLANKLAVSPTDELNQKFKLVRLDNGKSAVMVSDQLSDEDLSVKLLTTLNVDNECDVVYKTFPDSDTYYPDYVNFISDAYQKDQKITATPTKDCRDCEFKCLSGDLLKDGFKECWSETFDWKDADFQDPNILEIWDYKKKDELIENGLLKLKDITSRDFIVKTDKQPGLSHGERQWLQIEKRAQNDSSFYLDKVGLKQEFDKFVFPLHFIDFETSMPAIPFNKGRHPYEQLAFQFSHHIVYQDGDIEHTDEFLLADAGKFPNYEFLRALKKSLEKDQGTIFRYADHENTVLNQIYQQLKEDQSAISDKQELIDFIKNITHSSSKIKDLNEKWCGVRDMVDMLMLVKRYYYDPYMIGNNSIKKVLPAILNNSSYLQNKYSKPIYGAQGEIKSSNFKDKQWLIIEDDKIVEPYKQLPKIFQDHEEIDITLLSNSDSLADGGAALTAYAKLQFTEMSDYERNEIKKALLKYCELDTFAMVMIYEGWREMLI